MAGLAGAISGSSPAAVPLFASASAAGTTASAAALALPRPAGTAPGHVLVAAVSARNATGAAAPPGWVEAVRTTCSGNDSIDLTQAVFVRVAGSAEPAAYGFTSAATGIAGTVAAYAGVDAAAPVLAAAGQIRRNSRLVTAPSVTTAVPGALLAGAFSHTGRSALTAPDGMTARIAASATPDVRLLASDELRPAAGPTGERTAGSTQINTCAVGQLVVLRPAPDPPQSTSPPVVSGLAQEGGLVSATTGTWTWSPTGFAYQWQRGDGDDWADVPDATAAQLPVTGADVGERLRVVVTASNSGGSGSATSAPTDVVLPAAPVNLAPPTLAGEPIEEGTLTADPGAWTGAPSFAFAWERSADGAAWSTIPNASASSYELRAADVGLLLRVVVTGSNAGGSASAASAPLGPVEPAGPPVSLTPPTLSGWAQAGETLTATTGTWSGSPTAFDRVWQRSVAGAPWSDVGVGALYVLGPDDVGALVRVVVTATNDAGPASAPSAAVGPVAPALPPVNLVPPALVGVAAYGVPLTATTGTWANAPRDYAYRWLRSADGGATWEPIPGATGGAYVPGIADVGLRVAVEVTASNASGEAAAQSPPSEPVASPPPESVSPPTIGGDAVEGSALLASTGAWTNGPDTFGYLWERCDAAGCAEIRWFTDASYTLRRDDVGFAVRVRVTASNPGGAATATSTETAVVLPLPPANEASPVVTGVAAEGETLTSSNGTWRSSAAVSYSHRWQRSADGGQAWVDVGAPGATYLVGAADVGSILRAVVTAANAGGATEAASAATNVVTPPGAPTVLVPPSVSGVIQERGRLNALEGTWSGTPDFSYAWQRSTDGGQTWSAVPRGSTSRYTAVAADVGRLLRVLVTGRNDQGSLTVASESWLIRPAGGGELHLANSTWYCNTAVDLGLVRVTIMDGRLRDAIRIDACSGRIGRVEVTTNGIDGLKVRNTEPVAQDLTIESGFVRCTGRPAGAHQDGIQVLGGTRVTFRNLVVWCGDPESQYGAGVNSSALIAAGGSGGAGTPTDVVIVHSVMGPGTANGVLVEASLRSGLRGSVACPDATPAGGPVLIGAGAVDGIDEANEKPGLEDARCSSFEAALAWAAG